MADVAALVLAAGEGRRYRADGGAGPKVLAQLDGRPLLAHVLDLAGLAGLRPVLVVVPPDTATFAPVLAARSDVRAVVNPDSARGMATSLVAGLDVLGPMPTVAACVVLLADQPAVEATVVEQVVAEWRRTGRPVRARYADGAAHPVLLPREWWATIVTGLREAAADEGARGMLAGIGAIDLHVAGPMPVDVDVPADLDRAGRHR